jgi:hypothetical protein
MEERSCFDEATVKQIATEIEESFFSFLNKDVGPKYKNRYRNLIYRIIDKKIIITINNNVKHI